MVETPQRKVSKLLYVTAIGPQPEPPEIFNANVQALVYAVDTDTLAEVAVGKKFKNLNMQIAMEDAAPPSLDKTFGNGIVAIDANYNPNDPRCGKVFDP